LQISAFQDRSPRGFGLVQRNRTFASYQDLEAAYQRRPSLWIEPVGDWGAGAVTLVEIPTNSEIHDNIVAYWAPQDKIPAGTEYFFAYRLFWGGDPTLAAGAAYVASTRSGRAGVGGPTPVRLFVIDYGYFEGVDPTKLGNAKASVQASKGTVKNVVVAANPETHGLRLSFELDPGNETLIELTAALAFESGQTAETWAFRWTS
jgi:glucans biosynthesis protein